MPSTSSADNILQSNMVSIIHCIDFTVKYSIIQGPLLKSHLTKLGETYCAEECPKVNFVHLIHSHKLCKQYEHNNSHLKFILDAHRAVGPRATERHHARHHSGRPSAPTRRATTSTRRTLGLSRRLRRAHSGLAHARLVCAGRRSLLAGGVVRVVVR